MTSARTADPNAPATTSPAAILSRLSEQRGDTAAMLESMIEHFRRERRPMELFESLKMRVRHRLGLPLMASENDEICPDDIDRQLEQGLLDACREAGSLLIQDGKVREGWMYLRPTGDAAEARRLLAQVPITDDNYDEMLQVLLHEGVDIGRGYQAIIEHQGTCNSITVYEQAIASRSRKDRQTAARILLEHLYQELCSAVRGDIARREAPADEAETLVDMLESRRWILQEGGYHLDTTHLASTVRIASVLDQPELLRKAWELTQYGRGLAHQFQYPGDEPFVDFYPAYATFYATLLGEQVEAGLKFFERRARSVDVKQHSTGAIETYIDLLDRTGRSAEAVRTAIELVPAEVPAQRIVPLLIDIASRVEPSQVTESYGQILAYCQRHADALGYAAVSDALTSRLNPQVASEDSCAS